MHAEILIVEDNKTTRDLYRALLGLVGDYSVKTLERADEAVSYLRAGGPSELIITDLDMPGGSGLDVLEQARESAPDVPCIVCSGNLAGFYRQEIQALGIRKILRKPFTVTEFTSEVRACLQPTGAA
jgi:CheY-like chemotaxis protein